MLPPRPKPPQYVGDGDSRTDVTKLTDRAVAIKALDVALRVRDAVKPIEDDKVELLKMATDFEHRLSALEGRPREPLASSHEWDDLLVRAGRELSKRVKDKGDGLNSDRARQIAAEVVDMAKTADDAKSFRKWRSGARTIALEAIKYVVIAAIGFAASHFGLHGGHFTDTKATSEQHR